MCSATRRAGRLLERGWQRGSWSLTCSRECRHAPRRRVSSSRSTASRYPSPASAVPSGAWVCRSKKSLPAAERDEEGRGLWREEVGERDPRVLVIVDECGTHTSMAHLRARAPKGERVYGRVLRNRGRNTTLLASMTHEGMGPCLAVVGSTTKAVFEVYVEEVLAPTLSPGQGVVLGNLGAHRGERVRQ